MILRTFFRKNNITLSPSVLALCEEGLRRMKASIDITHTPEHVERIVNHYIRVKPNLKDSKFREDVFLTAVFWHDAWKAQFGSNGFIRGAYAQIMEGILSARLFRRSAVDFVSDPNFVRSVTYAIRKHSQFQILPLTTKEAQLLWDLDKLDKWEPKRFIEIKDDFFATRSLIGRKLFKLYMNLDTDKGIHNSWLKNEFNKRKKKYFEEIGI